ncbi:MAG: hypothetical protein ACREBS_05300, partial [Nitrososphaerales archaeon]
LPLPAPRELHEIHSLLDSIDDNLFNGSEGFIRQQATKALNSLIMQKVSSYDKEDSEFFWLNVLSVFNANQQINEACNKMWATAELSNVGRGSVWKHGYSPIGKEFSTLFLSGTLIPTLYYSQVSAMISSLSIFGCVPILVNGTPYYLVRTVEGWKSFVRRNFIKEILGKKVTGWHEQIIETYFGLIMEKIRLPKVSQSKLMRLKKLRNEMHYNVLGDIKMWRVIARREEYQNFVPFVDKTICGSIELLQTVTKVTNGCDNRYSKLRAAMEKDLKLL